jgi:acetyl-CoA C-acetyltransferase/3-oxo-5,6-didehydrosuberyl-CoA/3-oxoadipyl-CoA thiolase
MKVAFIISGVRTPVGRAGGVLADVRADDLAALAVRTAVERAGVAPASIDDVILGCTNQAGEDNRNVARMAVLLAGLPIDVPGQTVNRLCGSGLQSVASAAQAIKAGECDVFVAGGVESMTRAPYVMLKSSSAWNREVPAMADTTVGWRFTNPRMNKDWTISLGLTAEKVAREYGITREAQDEFAAESHKKAAAAGASNRFEREVAPIKTTVVEKGVAPEITVSQDVLVRPDTSAERLAGLKPAVDPTGSVPAGHSSPLTEYRSAVRPPQAPGSPRAAPPGSGGPRR